MMMMMMMMRMRITTTSMMLMMIMVTDRVAADVAVREVAARHALQLARHRRVHRGRRTLPRTPVRP
jgi:hypothetical protein